MNGYNAYWSMDSFGNGPVPQNWEEITSAANDIIGDVLQDTECYDAAERCSSKLWEAFCETDSVGNVKAIW